MLIMFVTPFITAFEMDLGIISGSETGMDYITNMFDFEEDDKDSSSKNDWFNKDEYSEYSLIIENDIEKWIMRGLVAVLLIYAVINFVKALSSFSRKNQDTIINQSLTTVKAGFGWNIAYYIFCMYIILKGHEWDFESILSGDAIVTTQTHMPMIFQIIVVATAMFLYKHWGNAISGKTAPLNLGIGGSAQSTQIARIEQLKYQTGHTAQSTRSEMKNLELLKKYKELFDTGVITEKEFNAKKKELLAISSNAQSNRPTEQETEINKQPTDHSERQEKSAEKELSRVCHKCGYPLTSTQQVCPHCGKATTEKDTYGMKWYKFLIHFGLFANAVGNVIGAMIYFKGGVLGGLADLLYKEFIGFQAINFICSMAYIGLAIMTLVTRNALYRHERQGPKLLFALYILNAAIAGSYAFFASAVAGQTSSGWFIASAFCFVMAIVNNIYFEKREDMFTY